MITKGHARTNAIMPTKGFSKTQWYLIITIMIAVSLQAIPKYFQSYLMIERVPLHFVAFCWAFVSILLVSVRGNPLKRLYDSVTIGAIAWGAFVGLFAVGDELFRFGDFATDIALFIGLLAALALRNLRSAILFSYLCHSIYWLSFALLCLSILLLRIGLIHPAMYGGRVFDVSMYYTASVGALLLPAVTLHALSRGRSTLAAVTILAGLGASAAFADMSATRSVIVVVFIAGAVTGIMIVAREGFSIRMFAFAFSLVLIALVALATQDDTAFRLDNLSDRIQSVGYRSDDRSNEAFAMLDRLGDRWLTGVGFGVGFYSQIVTAENPSGYSATTHIGHLSYLYKLGVLGFGMFVVAPFVMTLITMIRAPRSPAGAYAASLAVFFVQSSLSGGFHYSYVFVAAILFSGMTLNHECAGRAPT